MCKKVLLVIVEGETDETALKSSLENIFEDKETYVYVVGGDITSNWDVPDDELCDEIEAILNEIMTRYGLTEEDFLGIIHVSDTDGAFIKSKYVVLDKSESYPRNEDKIYSESEIRTSHRIKYIQRNRRKKRRMNTLLANANILDVKYGFYYMSSCLDHVLYDKTNLSGKQKRIEADSFNEKTPSNAGYIFFRNSLSPVYW